MKRSFPLSLFVGLSVAALVLAALVFAVVQVPQGQASEQQPMFEYPEYPPTATIAPFATEAPSLAATTLFSADFSDASALSSWTFADLVPVLPGNEAGWTLAPGANNNQALAQNYAGAIHNASTHPAVALAGDAGWTDYTASVGFYDQQNGIAGLVVRYQPGPNGDHTRASFYRYRIVRDSFSSTPKQVLEKVVNGVATSFVELKSPGFIERVSHTLAFSVVGGTLTVRLDGQIVAEAQDPNPLPAGQAGIYTLALGGILFDDFRVVTP